jgi:hypothetical protein
VDVQVQEGWPQPVQATALVLVGAVVVAGVEAVDFAQVVEVAELVYLSSVRELVWSQSPTGASLAR